jgi:hypothetical protein
MKHRASGAPIFCSPWIKLQAVRRLSLEDEQQAVS